MNFNKSQALRLEALLDDTQYPEVLNYQECYGFLCALVAGPVELDSTERNQIIFFGDEPSDASAINIEACELINTLQQEIENTLFSGETLLLPCSLQLEDNSVSESLEDWALGFFEAHLLDENSWYKTEEDLTAEMLMPILLCLEEIEDEEILKIKNNKELFQNVILQIPQALQDLYLYFHVNES